MSTVSQYSAAVQVATFIVVFISVIVGAGRNDSDFVMGLLNILVFSAFDPSGLGNLAPHQQDIISDLPNNIRGALSKFELEAKTTTYAVCPACHCTYKPHFIEGDSLPQYPPLCTNKPNFTSEECSEPLLRRDFSNTRGSSSSCPIKPFVYHSFHDYLSGLLARKDLEQVMDKTCDDLAATLDKPPPSMATDVWEAQFLRTFDGPTKGVRFVDRGTEGRYGFVMNVDFCNIEGMRIRGASNSTGVLSLACINLPTDIRYKPENMYMVIIPGPRKPKDIALNYYLEPLVNDMEESWNRGVRYSKTANYPLGRTTRSGIIIAAMDLPAARDAAQLAGHGAHIFCTVCKCTHRTNLDRVDHENWEFRDDDVIRHHAEAWRDAKTLADRVSIFDSHGTRWSELWRLPYWSPVRQLVVDPMHCLFESLVANHFRVFLGLTMVSATTADPRIPAFQYKFSKIEVIDGPLVGFTENEVKQLGVIHTLLTAVLIDPGDVDSDLQTAITTLEKKLMSKNKLPLKYVCENLGLIPPPKPNNARLVKKDWVRELLQWVSFIANILSNTDSISSGKNNLYTQINTHQPNWQLLRTSVSSRMSSLRHQCHLGWSPYLATLGTAVLALSRLMSGEHWERYIFP